MAGTTTKTTVQKAISKGMRKIATQKLNATFTAYEGSMVEWDGAVSFNFKPTTTRTLLASGDDPAWAVVGGYTYGDVEIVLNSVPLDKMEELFGISYSADTGVCVGDPDVQRFIGIACDNMVQVSTGVSTNKTILHKVLTDLPEILHQTIDETNTPVATVKVTGKAYPVFFNTAAGASKARTCTIVNSALNKAKFDANEAQLVFPSDAVA